MAANIEQLAINTIRTLAMDAVQAADSGHPGTPMALAPIAYKVWADELNYDPAAPHWPNRDRYVLSCGHASMLLYAMIHVAGIRDNGGPALPLEQIKLFRQLGSLTPGHPEYGHTVGVETTTGPLGQGCGNSVGIALAERWLAARYNKPGFELFSFNVFVQCSDGDLMEGVACEAASLAGHLKLSNLCWIYDDNNITIEGETHLAFSENVPTKFRGLGWHVEEVADANDLAALGKAIAAFRKNDAKPTMIVVKSIIGFGSPNKANTHGAHGAPLGEAEIKLTKAAYGWPDEKWLVPAEVLSHFQQSLGQRGKAARLAWEKLLADYTTKYPAEAAELKLMLVGELPPDWDADLPTAPADPKGTATRNSGGKALNAVAKRVPWLVGGSADLAPSTKTLVDGPVGDFGANNYGGRNLHFGIREHAMASAANGMALTGLRPYVATFFVFSDYLRPAMRLSALMKLPVIYVFTHDSIGVGEDGPTHQPVEQLAAARAIPHLIVLRPSDTNETSEAWRVAMSQTSRPVALVLTRQDLPTVDRTKYGAASGLAKGAYILADAAGTSPDVILMASGSEVSLAFSAYEKLTAAGTKVRLVSVPSMELFAEQPAAYRDSVLPPKVTRRVAVEAGIRMGWDRLLGNDGRFVGMSDFGASGPYDKVYAHCGITVDAVVAAAKA